MGKKTDFSVFIHFDRKINGNLHGKAIIHLHHASENRAGQEKNILQNKKIHDRMEIKIDVRRLTHEIS
ncbi:MAG: hypothetical protein IKM00_00275 [Clostridia bacterium]|nr:hypothetical protein [Clostridia bacterium]